MAGSKPRPLTIPAADRMQLRWITREHKRPWREIRRARVLLLMAAGTPVNVVADKTDMDVSSVWRICRRYEARGIGCVEDAPRPGRRGNGHG